MPQIKRWTFLLALAGLGAVLFVRFSERSSDSATDQSRPQSSHSEPLEESILIKHESPDAGHFSFEDSPYPQLSADDVRQAHTNDEQWANSYAISDTWTLQLAPDVSEQQILTQLGAESIEQVAPFSDVYVVQILGSEIEANAKLTQDILSDFRGVKWFEQEIIETFALRYDETPPPFSDPQLKDQWHLRNVGDRWNVAGEDANLYPAWNYGFSGAGIYIAIVDTGTEGSHPDLAPNYRSDLDFDYIDNDASAAPEADDETHGTAVAGVAGAAANLSCGVGSAFNSEILGIRLIHENIGVTSSRQASAISHRSDLVDIYNNSWGPSTEDGARMAGPGNLAFSAMKSAIENGRDGLGSIYVWAAGNGRAISSNVNYDGWAAHRYSIAVGAVGDHGKLSDYSEPGAAMLVTAHSNGDTSGIRTTDLQGPAGADPGDCRIEFGGTSSAAPLVAGIVALMLEANPNLTWRDVQHILAKTAVKVATTNNDWVRNSAGYWINHNFGFGRVDAAAAVKVALNWTPVKEEVIVTSNLLSLNQQIPDNSNAGIQAFHSINENIRIEHVAVTIDLRASEGDSMDWGNLKITLTAPSGTESILAEPHTDAQKSYPFWTYWSVRHLDETSQGTWTLSIRDLKTGNTHLAESWSIELYGTEIEPDDNQPPVANRDSFIITETTSFLDVVANDTDPDGDTFELLSIYRSPHSSVTIDSSGLVKYTPGEGLNGRDRFGYTIHDGRGGIRTAEVDIEIPRPYASDDHAATLKNRSISIPVLANDIDYDGDNLRIKSFTRPTNGLAELDGFLNINYTPDEGFIGVDHFNYVVTDDEDGETEARITVTVTAAEDFALLFDGDNDQITIEGSENDHLNTTFTIESWIRPTGWGESETGYGRIMDKDTVIFYLHGNGFAQYNPNSLLISLNHTNGNRSVYNTPENSIRLNEWQHIAVTYDNVSEVNLFIDGIEQLLSIPFDSASGPVETGTQAIILGEAGNRLRAFKGAMDEFRVWSRVKSPAEILEQKSMTLMGDEEDLIIYYPMNEGLGIQLANASSSQKPGIISGPKWIRGIISENAPPQPSVDEVETLINKKVIIPVTGNDLDPDGDDLTIKAITNITSGSASILDGSIIFQPDEDFTGLVRIDYLVDDGYNGTTTSSLILVVGEGLYYTAWEAKNYSGSLGSAEEDSDFDHHTNFKEYAFGTDPLSGYQDPLLWNLQFDDQTGITTFTYTVLIGSIDVNYKLKVSSDMENWTIPVEGLDYSVLTLSNPDPDTETRVIAFQPVNGSPVYVRLEAISLIGAQ